MLPRCPNCDSNRSLILPSKEFFLLAHKYHCVECGCTHRPSAPVFRMLAILTGMAMVLTAGPMIAFVWSSLTTVRESWMVLPVAGLVGGTGLVLIHKGITCRAGILATRGFPVVMSPPPEHAEPQTQKPRLPEL